MYPRILLAPEDGTGGTAAAPAAGPPASSSPAAAPPPAAPAAQPDLFASGRASPPVVATVPPAQAAEDAFAGLPSYAPTEATAPAAPPPPALAAPPPPPAPPALSMEDVARIVRETITRDFAPPQSDPDAASDQQRDSYAAALAQVRAEAAAARKQAADLAALYEKDRVSNAARAEETRVASERGMLVRLAQAELGRVQNLTPELRATLSAQVLKAADDAYMAGHIGSAEDARVLVATSIKDRIDLMRHGASSQEAAIRATREAAQRYSIPAGSGQAAGPNPLDQAVHAEAARRGVPVTRGLIDEVTTRFRREHPLA